MQEPKLSDSDESSPFLFIRGGFREKRINFIKKISSESDYDKWISTVSSTIIKKTRIEVDGTPQILLTPQI